MWFSTPHISTWKLSSHFYLSYCRHMLRGCCKFEHNNMFALWVVPINWGTWPWVKKKYASHFVTEGSLKGVLTFRFLCWLFSYETCIINVNEFGLNENGTKHHISGNTETMKSLRQIFGFTCINYNQHCISNIKGFLWLAGWSNSKPVFFHWRHEWTPSEFSLANLLYPASPYSGFEIPALIDYIC